MQISLSVLDMAVLCLCGFIGLYARCVSVCVYSLIEKEEYRYLGRVLLHRTGESYAIHIPARFIDRSVTTRFVVTLPGFCCKKHKYSQLSVHYAGHKKCIFIQHEGVLHI